MDNNRPQIMLKAAMHYGLILGAGLIVFKVAFFLLIDLEAYSLMSISLLTLLFSVVPLLAGVVLCMKHFRDKEFRGSMSYVEGLRYGTMLMLFAGILLAGYDLVFNNWISPDYVAQTQTIIKDKTIEFMVRQKYPDSIIEEQSAVFDKLIVGEDKKAKLIGPLYSIPMYGLAGLVISLIVAAVLKRNNKDSFTSAMEGVE